MTLTHKMLVDRAAKWLAGTMKCSPVIVERNCYATAESPDAFGINSDGTIVVECKTSVRDFYADLQKPFRKAPEDGMGRLRFYLTPPRLINPDRLLLAPGWGLLEVRGSIIRVVKDSAVFRQSSNAECLLVRSWILTPPRSKEDAA